jgi:prepilin signal peptidase PulO-like enzyme (type II secretory pathway)
MQNVVLEIFVWLFGLCVGSFLNVVVYRLPLGLSIARPVRSFCPRCGANIAWYDNIPLLSWLLLRARCRHCGGGISVQYPLVEALTGLSFVLAYHLLFVAQARTGVVGAVLPTDVPLLLSWLILTAGLVACTAMDIVSYSIDVRVTNAVLYAGLVLHALWPRPEFLTPRATGPAAAAALAALLVSAVMLWWSARRLEQAEGELPVEPADTPAPAAPPAPVAQFSGVLGVFVTVALVGWLIYAGLAGVPAAPDAAVAAALATAFAALVIAGGQQRPADQEIQNAIAEEQPQARRVACRESLWLMPAILAAAVTWYVLVHVPAASETWRNLTTWRVGEHFVPLGGLAYGVHGAIIAAAAGWALRIVFTLAFGREAFGTGDIYILAAAGASAGWDIALLGLLLSVGVALLGWLLGLLLKSTAMIPFGPWLSLGLLLALWWSRPAQHIAESYRDNVVDLFTEHPGTLPVAIGLVLVATAAAMVLARLARRWLVPDSS